MSNNNSSILIDVALPVKCSPEEFDSFYNECYKQKITHKYIIDTLGLSNDVKIKFNGTFTRTLSLLDNKANLYDVIFKVQTALYYSPKTKKNHYVSIMPSFIKKHCPFSLTTLEYIAITAREGESIFNHIDDPLRILECEDRIVKSIRRIEANSYMYKYSALLNSKYTKIYNRALKTDGSDIHLKRFKSIYELIVAARAYFGVKSGVLSRTNKLITL